ncbi:MAG: sensor histidine kinase [Rectinemataceae bacterium]
MRIHRIQATLVRAFALIVVMTIALLGTVSLNFFRKTLVDSAQQSTMQFAAQLSRIVDNYITYMNDIALVVMGDEDVRAYMAAPTAGSARDRSRIGLFLGSIRKVRKDIDGVFLLPGRTVEAGAAPDVLPAYVIASSPGERVNPDCDFRRFTAVGSLATGADIPYVSSAHVENMVDGRYPWVISLVREIRGPEGSALGYIQVDLNYAIIEGLCKDIQLGSSGYVFILDKSGDIVYHPRQQLIYGNLKTERIPELLALREGFLTSEVDGREILYTAKSSGRTGWIIVVVSYLSEFLAGSQRAIYTFLLLAILCFAVSVFVSSFVSARISRPIEALRRSMQEVEKGNFDMDITVECSNEVYQLARDCDIAVKKVRDLIEQNRKNSEQRRLLELRALQAQINPHFLYNTLDSIIWMVELGENQKAIDVTSSLARFFRLGINRGSEIITIRTEIEYLETYLSIQKTRYKDKLDYEISFQPELYGYRILKLLVQPLVENAIYHGIKNKESPGIVRVYGEKKGGTMLIRVSDDGVGMDSGKLDALRRSLVMPPDYEAKGGLEASSVGVGVRNVQERIALYFGPEYCLDFESTPGVGTTATIRIPLVEEAEP